MTIVDSNALTSRQLAELIIESLIRAGFLSKSAFDQAVAVCEEEIDARKAVGDY